MATLKLVRSSDRSLAGTLATVAFGLVMNRYRSRLNGR
jgi:hypothetical protein